MINHLNIEALQPKTHNLNKIILLQQTPRKYSKNIIYLNLIRLIFKPHKSKLSTVIPLKCFITL